jgi:hypothetical protein
MRESLDNEEIQKDLREGTFIAYQVLHDACFIISF